MHVGRPQTRSRLKERNTGTKEQFNHAPNHALTRALTRALHPIAFPRIVSSPPQVHPKPWFPFKSPDSPRSSSIASHDANKTARNHQAPLLRPRGFAQYPALDQLFTPPDLHQALPPLRLGRRAHHIGPVTAGRGGGRLHLRVENARRHHR